jgi:DNA-directed RNA polymerase subunit RPC12/RpoP
MNKALIEKAFKKYCETTKLKVNPVCDRASRCELCKSSWLAGATWQREQLEANQTKIKCSNCGAKVSSSVPKDTVIRGYVECPECITKTNVATVTHDIYKQAREQLEAEKNKLIKDTEVCRKATNGTDDYSVGMRNGMEVILCTLEKREPRMDNCLPRTNNLSEREQLIQELREWVNSNEGRIETDGKTWYKLVNGTDLLAKLDDLLEKGGC